jgi:hypothetical protein
MDNIYQVVAQFDDGESISYILIGNFTNLEVANDCKEKWDSFFKHHQILFDKPQDWDFQKDEWSKDQTLELPYFDDPQWSDSKEYYSLLAKWGRIREFIKIDVNKLEINQEVFISNNMFYDPMVQLMTQWDRDWKIDKLNDR